MRDSLRIVAVADTHSRPHPKLDERLNELAPQYILHAGDVGNLDVLKMLERHAPVIAVRGNIDGRDLPDAITIDVCDEKTTLLKILLTHIAVNGPKLRADVVRLAQKEDASLVVCGHSHVPFAAHDRGITVFNPGSAGPKRFELPILFGTIEIARSGVSVAHFECETGKRWQPSAREAPPKGRDSST
jgi:putative phosphoesterase